MKRSCQSGALHLVTNQFQATGMALTAAPVSD